jgi:hypothetical protein
VQAPVLRLASAARLSGAVVRRGGEGIAAAKVTLATPGAEAPFAVAVSDVRGSFTLPSLPAGLYLASAAADGFRATARVVSIAPGQDAHAEFRLLAGGTVRDAKGSPVALAIVRGGSREAATQGPAIEGTTVSGDDGRYLLDGLAPGQARVMALLPGSAAGPAQIVEVPEEGVAEADFVLGEEGFFEGHVSVAGGKPLAAPAKISLRLQSLANDFRNRVALPVDADGWVRATLPVGDYSANANFLGVRVGSPGVKFSVAAGQTVQQEFVLPDGEAEGQITVTVQEAGGAPAAGATAIVRASLGAQKMVTTAPVDSSGVLRMGKWADYPVDAIEVSAVLEGRAAKAVVHRPDTSLTLLLGSAASLHGRVRGAVRDGFTVSVSPGDDGDLPFGVEPRTFSGTSFAFADLPAAPTLLRVVTPDGRSAEQRAVLVAGLDVEVVLDLQPAASVVGRVVDSAGAPLAAWVNLDQFAAGDTPGADGRFHFDDLAAGEHTLAVQPPRGEKPVRRQFALQAGERLDLGDVVVPAAAPPPPPPPPRKELREQKLAPPGSGALSAR